MNLIKDFSKELIAWHDVDGRQGLPWQNNRDPYAVWVSEIMLQQTQVATVLERYPRFMKRFSTVQRLAAADIDEVLAEWAGLGYYSRARNLHACAKQVMEQFSGKFPSDPVLLEQLKGIGRSTAGAIAAFAFHERAPILDANVKRILARLFCINGALQDKKVNERLWDLASSLLPTKPEDMPIYTQALMDFGATWCTSRKPVCLIGCGKPYCPSLVRATHFKSPLENTCDLLAWMLQICIQRRLWVKICFIFSPRSNCLQSFSREPTGSCGNASVNRSFRFGVASSTLAIDLATQVDSGKHHRPPQMALLGRFCNKT